MKILSNFGICTIFLLLSIFFAYSADINQLISSYNYNFNDGTINITSKTDYMIDTNSNGINDTLIFNITSNATSGIYYAFIDLYLLDRKITESVTKTLSSQEPFFVINFSTDAFLQSQYNYTIRIKDSNNITIYREFYLLTNNYTNYEGGNSITSISDSNINDDKIKLSLSLNVTRNETVNVTATLKYKDSYISSNEQFTLIIPEQTIDIYFDNETIKSTHYNGKYSIENIKIGEKIIQYDYNTSVYDYETFAKTSYIKNISSYQLDNNSNNLSDNLNFNFTLNIKSAGTYTIQSSIYDEENNFIANLEKNITLSTGINEVSIPIDGKTLYSTYYNGELSLSFVKLSINNLTYDIIYNAYTTDIIYYSDFERPNLPDLRMSMNVSFQNNISNVTINLTNAGTAPAFNIFIDIFDNSTYENQSSTSYLAVNESILFKFQSSSANDSIFTAIADFSNYVDENNESNNIINNAREPITSLSIPSITELYSLGTYKIFEFIIYNDGDYTINNIFWQFNTGESIINSTYNISLVKGESVYVYIEYNYSAMGNYSVSANATGTEASGYYSIQTDTRSLEVTSFTSIYTDGNKAVFEAVVKSSNPMQNINWHLNDGNGSIISSTIPFNLEANESIYIYVEHQYNGSGTYYPVFNATSDTESYSLSSQVTINPSLMIMSLDNLYYSDTTSVFEMDVKNILQSSVLNNINWSMQMGDGNTIYANQLFSLEANETIAIFVEYNYSTTGDYVVLGRVNSNSIQHEKQLNFDLKDIEAENLTLLYSSGNVRVFELKIKNYLPNNIENVSWKLDTKNNAIINSTIPVNLSANEEMYVYIEQNFTSGIFNVNATAIYGSYRDSINYTITVS